MSGNVLDTNIIIDLFRGDEKTKSFLNNFDFEIPVIVIGELFYGAENSSNKEKHFQQIKKFTEEVSIINSTEDTAKIYASIKSDLKQQGKPIPENDIWIAAIAIENNKSLVTNDQHFLSIKNLKIINLK
ncbi:type II toxin-antitoxin system VapC family toxin [Epilithonimonas xixisoli]|uniref:tRNA(fMet)-specific endonuclease VapC n=1 Tax=Epilithonimonas xixisoli TaxID=1476462 RepID=A0A4R8IBN5_9FLAO|nr:type II toxin-antitoxin system VapC family toxin [Epilithonimonas xixisoli]TDX84781.1 tRNA(fMet)-specific endonuclease VapC [Epilithonimonas xixisoli]